MVDKVMPLTREIKFMSGVLLGESSSCLVFHVMTASIISLVNLNNMRLLICADNIICKLKGNIEIF
jgi:hypothetical protein